MGSRSMETHFPRERGRAEQGEGKEQGGLFGGGHSNNDSIHSFTPITQLNSFCLHPPLFLRTPSTFRQPTTTITMHPLSDIITNKQTGFGVGGTHPTRYY